MECLEPSLNFTPKYIVDHALSMQYTLTAINLLPIMTYLNIHSSCPKDGDSYDYIIVGGGTSGCVIANRLSEDSAIKTLLIEAGGNFPIESSIASLHLYLKGSQHEWNYELANGCMNGRPKNNFITLAGKVLGGTSSVDMMVNSPSFDTDYENWAELTKEGSWRFENIQRLRKNIERLKDTYIENSPDKIYHGFDGKVSLIKDRSPTLEKYFKIFDEAGHKILPDINNGNKQGISGSIFYNDKVRQNSAYAYLNKIKNRSNLFVMKEMQVTKIIINDDKKAIGVVAVDTKTNTQYTFKAKLEVIIAAGAFNTPKLLQLSGIGPKDILQSLNISTISNLPVGYNLQNRASIPFIFALEKTETLFSSMTFSPYKFPDASFEGFAALNKSQDNPDYRLFGFVAPYTPPTVMAKYTLFYYRYEPEVVEFWHKRIRGREVMVVFIDLTKPKSRGLVRIQSQNPFESPIIHAEHFSEEIDLKNTARYIKDFLKILKSSYLKEIGGFLADPMVEKCGAYEYDCDEYWMCYARHLMLSNSHQCGTAAMGSVVDGRLRVFGVEGLRVADSSIMPTITSGSTTVPSMAIGENAAEMIRQDRRNNILCKKYRMCRIK